jgi:hypothetical protein
MMRLAIVGALLLLLGVSSTDRNRAADSADL